MVQSEGVEWIMRIVAAICVTPLALLTFAGCLEGSGDAYQVYATGGKFAVGFAYDGAGIQNFGGPAYLNVNEAANTGVFVAQGKMGAAEYRIVIEDYSEAPGKAFQNGGIAADFREHGASGVGDRTIPEVDLEMAGWGLATITAGGKPYKDVAGGKDQWAAHFMVIRNGVRNDTNGQVHTTDHKVYNPDRAGEGLTTSGDYELHLVIRNQTSNESSQPTQIGPFGSSQPAPTLNAAHTFTVNSIGSAVQLDFTVSGTGATASNVSFRVTSPSGDLLYSRGLGPGMTPVGAQSTYTTQFKFPATEIGTYTIQATGRVAPGGAYSARGAITPPASTVLNFWWEDLVFGAEAEQMGDSSGLLEGTRFHGTHDHPAPTASTSMPRRIR